MVVTGGLQLLWKEHNTSKSCVSPKSCNFFHSSAYRFPVYKFNIADICEDTIIESRNTVFFENIFSYSNIRMGNLHKRIDNTTTRSDQGNID